MPNRSLLNLIVRLRLASIGRGHERNWEEKHGESMLEVAGQTRTLAEKAFNCEAELEKYIHNNQELLGGDVYIISRQIRGAKQGIPDMLGVDQDSRVCIMELKNGEAGEDILPQSARLRDLGRNERRLYQGDLAREREKA